MSMSNIGRQAAKTIWSGPFSVGSLTQPISLGAAILKILEVVWKGIVSLLLGIAAVSILVGAWQPINLALNPSFESQLVGEAHFDPELCAKDFPIVVIVRNDSKRSLASAQIDLVIRQPGRSTNLNRGPSGDWDAIVKPGKRNALCYSLPSDITDDPKTLDY